MNTTRLAEIYTNRGQAGSYASAAQLYREAKRRGLDVNKAEVADFVARFRSESLYRPSKLKDLVTFAAAVNHKWQLDLGFYPPYKGFSAFLVCVDVLSRKCYLRLLKGKTSERVAKAFEDILLQSGQSPSFVVSDRGSEFLGAAFREVLGRRSIAQYFANPPHKAAIAERVIGSLKQAEGRLAQAFPGRNWPDRLESAVEAYNESVHSTTGLAPNEVGPHNANRVFHRVYRPFAGFWDLGKLVPLGTPVRLRLTSRGTFAKANSPRNSSEVYFVGRIRLHPGAGFKYKLFTAPLDNGGRPIAGTYERDEIVPIKLPQQ